jgi:hypothetical protein
VLEQRRRQPGELVAGGLVAKLVEGELDVDRVPVDDRVGDEVQAVRLGRLALERVQEDGAVVAVEGTARARTSSSATSSSSSSPTSRSNSATFSLAAVAVCALRSRSSRSAWPCASPTAWSARSRISSRRRTAWSWQKHSSAGSAAWSGGRRAPRWSSAGECRELAAAVRGDRLKSRSGVAKFAQGRRASLASRRSAPDSRTGPRGPATRAG